MEFLSYLGKFPPLRKQGLTRATPRGIEIHQPHVISLTVDDPILEAFRV